MYIGPWQEYNLSKTSNRNPVINQTLKDEIEKAIIESLDVESANIALTAINPYFESIPTGKKPPKPKIIFPPLDQSPYSNKQGRQLRSNLVTKLPTVNTLRASTNLIFSARDGVAASPASVRSTQSEPIKETFPPISNTRSIRPQRQSIVKSPISANSPSNTNAFLTTMTLREPVLLSIPNARIKDGRKQSNEKSVETVKPVPSSSSSSPSPLQSTVSNYNASAVIDLLRRERNKEARLEISRLTGWNSYTQALSRESSSETAEETKGIATIPLKEKLQAKKESKTEDKVEKVKQMRALYIAGESSGESPLAVNDSDSDIGVERIPKITDIDINESTLGLVSKYFSEGELTAIKSSTVIEIGNTKKKSEGLKHIIQSVDDFIDEDGVDGDIGLESFDGLLKWTSQLDVDNF